MRSARRAFPLLLVAAMLSPAVPAAGVTGSEREPSADQVTAARQRAAALRQAESAQASDVDDALVALQSAADDSALALESYAAAAESRRIAFAELARREQARADAEAAVVREHGELARWAREAYVDGGALGTSPALYTLLSGGTTDDVATHRTWLQRVGRSRAELEQRLIAVGAAAARAEEAARRAAVAAESTTAQAEAALAARDAVLAEQRRRVADLRSGLAETGRAANAAERDVVTLAAARAVGAAGPDGSGVRTVTGPVGECAGGDLSGYGNGEIPLDALCPLGPAPHEQLRADAAFAFDRLSAAYAERFGSGICVTDSYRSLADQVRVRAERPGLAAVPGHSNHGWGSAVDLCGGVERFDSAEHRWLRLNAPLFGWFHPSWAKVDGSLPEPWHWEYSG
jgi:hypothetical protein